MSSYFVNSTFPVSLPGGQESFLGQIPLYSSGYTDPLRHYPSATFGATNVQDKVYTSSYYQQAGGVFGRSGPTSTCDYTTPNIYRSADRSCAIGGLEDSLVLTQDQCKTDCTEQGAERYFNSEDKPCTAVYPWMQRMNSCNGKTRLRFRSFASRIGAQFTLLPTIRLCQHIIKKRHIAYTKEA